MQLTYDIMSYDLDFVMQLFFDESVVLYRRIVDNPNIVIYNLKRFSKSCDNYLARLEVYQNNSETYLVGVFFEKDWLGWKIVYRQWDYPSTILRILACILFEIFDDCVEICGNFVK